jgi:chromosome segregation ATPase
MVEKLKTTKPYEITYDNTYSYQKYLEEQEKRHSLQIEKIYRQNSEYNNRL